MKNFDHYENGENIKFPIEKHWERKPQRNI